MRNASRVRIFDESGLPEKTTCMQVIHFKKLVAFVQMTVAYQDYAVLPYVNSTCGYRNFKIYLFRNKEHCGIQDFMIQYCILEIIILDFDARSQG